jgi:hypothetical protein
MRTRTALLGFTGSVLLIGLCTGCARNTPGPVRAIDAPQSGAVKEPFSPNAQCPSDSQDPAVARLAALGASSPGTPIPAGYDAVAVVRCEDEVETVPGDGTWDTALAQRATGDLSALMTALRTPSSNPPTPADFACSAIGIAVPDFALVDAAGHIVRPILPHDLCDAPLTKVLDAVYAMPWKTETAQKLSQDQTQAEVDTGCLPAYKDVFDLPSPSATPWATGLDPTIACEYTVSGSAGGSAGVGEFDHGLKLSAAQQSAISAALKSPGSGSGSGSTAAKACSAQASTFALLMVSPSENAVVELDGCLRVSYPDYFVTQAPPALLAALRTAGI